MDLLHILSVASKIFLATLNSTHSMQSRVKYRKPETRLQLNHNKLISFSIKNWNWFASRKSFKISKYASIIAGNQAMSATFDIQFHLKKKYREISEQNGFEINIERWGWKKVSDRSNDCFDCYFYWHVRHKIKWKRI